MAWQPDWNTETAVALARGIEIDRAFDRMPILAHALEEAGCDSQQVLQHCRNESLHVVGCWVLDGVLGRGRSAGGTGESAVTEAGLEGEPEHGN